MQYGNITEIYQYEKDLVKNNKLRYVSKLQKKRTQEIKRLGKSIRTQYSVKRAKRSFFRLCHHNNINSETVTFVTLTLVEDVSYSVALRYLSVFFSKLKKYYEVENSSLSYIAVPELTKKARYHFHLLVYNLPAEVSERERTTRNIQRCCWQRGYIEVRCASTIGQGIAGYMAKYMGKFLADSKHEASRAYTCSRNIKKIRSAASNSLSYDLDLFIPDTLAERTTSYVVPYLGTCNFSKYQVL